MQPRSWHLVTSTALLLCFLHRACTRKPGYAESTKQCYDWGMEGECAVEHSCWCYCFDVKAKAVDISTAYFGEFGFELLIHLPYVYYMHQQGRLTKTTASWGTAPLYYFSRNHTETGQKRHSCSQGPHSHANQHERHFDYVQWVPPPYKEFYRNDVFKFSKPSLVIHNKYFVEWGAPPVNFINTTTLEALVQLLQPKYKIIYHRPVPVELKIKEYSDDANANGLPPLGDFEMLANYPDVVKFEDLHQKYTGKYTYNELQLMVNANSDAFISVQGGNSIFTSYFGGVNIVYAVRGQEMGNQEYEHIYQHLSNATVLRVKTYPELLETAGQRFL